MGLNWLEDIISHLYKLRGYIVVENEDLQMSKTEDRKVRGHSDIDVLAIKDKEVVHIECQSWWCPPKDDEKNHERLGERFAEAREQIPEKYSFLDKGEVKIRNIFVTNGKPKTLRENSPWQRLQNFCDDEGIELMESNEVICDLIKELEEKYPHRDRVGKEEGIARFLIHLIHNDFLKENGGDSS